MIPFLERTDKVSTFWYNTFCKAEYCASPSFSFRVRTTGISSTTFISSLIEESTMLMLLLIREFGIRKGLKKLVISSKIRIFIGENQ